MKLGIVLARHEDLEAAAAIARAARSAGHEVVMFAMDAGCHALAAAPAIAAELLDTDCEIIVCSNSAVELALPDGITRGSQDDHAAVLTTSDRVFALT
jgi:peroxiredoxin family protein